MPEQVSTLVEKFVLFCGLFDYDFILVNPSLAKPPLNFSGSL